MLGMTKSVAKKIVKEAMGANPYMFILKTMMTGAKAIDSIHGDLSVKRLENVRPMIFQLKH